MLVLAATTTRARFIARDLPAVPAHGKMSRKACERSPVGLEVTARPYLDPEWGHRLDMYYQVVPKGSGIVNRFLSGAKP